MSDLPNSNISELLAQRQLDAYNAHDILAFAECYSEDVEIFDFNSGQLLMAGREQLIERYGTLFENKALHAKLTNRMTLGAYAIDEEEVTGRGDSVIHAIAIYQVEDKLIRRVWFIKQS